jgi:hypothetical protein
LIRSAIYDSEINDAILNVKNHPMMKAMMGLLFQMWLMPFGRNNFQKHSIRDLIYIPYHSKVLEKSSDGLTTSGFEKLEKENLICLFLTTETSFLTLRC